MACEIVMFILYPVQSLSDDGETQKEESEESESCEQHRSREQVRCGHMVRINVFL